MESGNAGKRGEYCFVEKAKRVSRCQGVRGKEENAVQLEMCEDLVMSEYAGKIKKSIQFNWECARMLRGQGMQGKEENTV